VKTSDNAGSYLCNYVYYKSLCAFRNNSLVVFVHIADYQNNQDAVGLTEQVGFVREMIFELINPQLQLS
jgi:pyrrolidone-carboxylate peptidase